MRKPGLDIVNLIGISLVIVAIVSAGGLYYTAASYNNISETFATVTIDITGVSLTRDNDTGQVHINTLFLVNNPSNLDIEIYRIEYQVHADSTSSTVREYDRYVGNGGIGSSNNTISAGKLREIDLPTRINPDTTYMERFNMAEQDGSVFVFVDGIVWYRISKFQDASRRVDDIMFMGGVNVNGA